MAKKQSTDHDSPQGLAAAALGALNDACTTTKAYQLGDHADHTWGIEIPSLAFQWMIGGSNVFPCQRYLSVSGLPKSMKSTLIIEIGTWFAQQNGLFIPIDNESKTSASMLEALTWWKLTPDQQKMLLFKETASTEEWMDVCTAAIAFARDKIGIGKSVSLCFDEWLKSLKENAKTKQITPDQLKVLSLSRDFILKHRVLKQEDFEGDVHTLFGESFPKLIDELNVVLRGGRVPVFLTIDSLTGKNSEADQEAIEKEGHAEARGFPVRAGQITRYIESVQLTGTLMSIGYVRHLKQQIDGGRPGMAPPMKETGGASAGFKASLSIRIAKGAGVECASHPSMPHQNLTTQGYTLYMESNMSCLGPDHRKIEVDVLWQYVPQEDGSTRQLMKYDWGGSLGKLLWGMKYDEDKKLYSSDLERLDAVLHFTQPKSKRIKCEALGLDEANFSEFGNAIEAHPEIREKVSRFLNIRKYNNVQDVEIEAAPKKD